MGAPTDTTMGQVPEAADTGFVGQDTTTTTGVDTTYAPTETTPTDTAPTDTLTQPTGDTTGYESDTSAAGAWSDTTAVPQDTSGMTEANDTTQSQ